MGCRAEQKTHSWKEPAMPKDGSYVEVKLMGQQDRMSVLIARTSAAELLWIYEVMSQQMLEGLLLGQTAMGWRNGKPFSCYMAGV